MNSHAVATKGMLNRRNRRKHMNSMTTHLVAGAIALMTGDAVGAKTLKEVYARDFAVGAALPERYLFRQNDSSEKALEILAREFNCVTSENLMKPSSLRPAPGKFNFEQADAFMQLAGQLDLDVVGHVLVWHDQTPKWFFEDEDGEPAAREDLIEQMREHIHKIVKRYKGDVKYWDVVNEAVDTRQIVNEDEPVNPDGSTNYVNEAFFRETPWFNIIGADFIELAFRFAHEADPDAILIYNDFGMSDPVKVEFVIEHIVKPLKRKGVRIDAVGMQGHWHVDVPEIEQIKNAINELGSARVKVHITELDVSILPRAYGYMGADINQRFELQDELNPYRDGAPVDMLEKQADRYKELFRLFDSESKYVERVTLWGICDGDSWKNHFPVRGRTDYPLLFDRGFEPKPAYEALVR